MVPVDLVVLMVEPMLVEAALVVPVVLEALGVLLVLLEPEEPQGIVETEPVGPVELMVPVVELLATTFRTVLVCLSRVVDMPEGR